MGQKRLPGDWPGIRYCTNRQLYSGGAAMVEDDPSLLDRSGIFYVSPREQRRKLTRRAHWALWALLVGFALGFLLVRLFS